MGIYFAPPKRVSVEELANEIEIMSSNPVMSGLLHSISGLLAVFYEHRQIVALNASLLFPSHILYTDSHGLRPLIFNWLIWSDKHSLPPD